MKDKKEPIVLDLDIFIHLMTSAYREGFKAGAGKNIQRLENDCASAVSQFHFGMVDMLKEPESTVRTKPLLGFISMKETVQIQTPPCPEIREERRSVRFSSHCPFFIGSQLSPLAAFLKRYMRASARLRVLCKLPLSRSGSYEATP